MPEAATQSSTVIAPHGGSLVDRTVTGDEATALAEEAAQLPRIALSEKQTADLDMIASGALSPLTGFMTRDDYTGAVEEMHLANGLAWAIPVTLAVENAPQGDRVALEG
jgi:sulfate adenylyltransferase